MDVRDIRLHGDSSMESIRVLAQAAMLEWSHDWLVVPSGRTQTPLEVYVSTELGRAISADVFVCWELRDDRKLWVKVDAQQRRQFCEAVVGLEPVDDHTHVDEWVSEALDEGWTALCSKLCVVLLGDLPQHGTAHSPSRVPHEVATFGAGTLRLTCDALGLEAYLADAGRPTQRAIRRLGAPLSGLVPLDFAAGPARVRLHVILGTVELSVPDLVGLQVGDVMRLDTSVDEPANVSCQGWSVAQCQLGESDGYRAARLVSPHIPLTSIQEA